MSSPRFRPALFVCAGILTACVAGMAAAQTAPPGGSSASGKPASAQKSPKAMGKPSRAESVELDVNFDPVLIAINKAVKLNDEKTAGLMKRYLEFRIAQRTLMSEIRERLAVECAAAVAAAEAAESSGSGSTDRAERKAIRGAAQGRGKARMAIEKKLTPLNERFIADVRLMIDEPQLAAWDSCAAGLDLHTQPRYYGLRPEMRWRDPALGPNEGDVAPDFTLDSVEGKPVTLSSLLDRPVVLLFGSWTSPQFRRSIDDVEVLQRAYKDKVHFVLVYTFEAHPTDGWNLPQNTRAKIEIPQHASYDARAALAKETNTKLAPEWIVLIDDFENSVTKSYFGHPNRGYVISVEGVVRSKQPQFDDQKTVATLYETITGRSAASP